MGMAGGGRAWCVSSGLRVWAPSRRHGLRRSLARRVAGYVVLVAVRGGATPRFTLPAQPAPSGRTLPARGLAPLAVVVQVVPGPGMQLGDHTFLPQAKQDEAASRHRTARRRDVRGERKTRRGAGGERNEGWRPRRHGEPATRVRRGREPSAGRGARTRQGEGPAAAGAPHGEQRLAYVVGIDGHRVSRLAGARTSTSEQAHHTASQRLAYVVPAIDGPGLRLAGARTSTSEQARHARQRLAYVVRPSTVTGSRGSLALAPRPASRPGTRRASDSRTSSRPSTVTGSRGSLALAPRPASGPGTRRAQRLAYVVPAIDGHRVSRLAGARTSTSEQAQHAASPATRVRRPGHRRSPGLEARWRSHLDQRAARHAHRRRTKGPGPDGPGPFVSAGGATQERAWVRRNPRPSW